MRKKFNDNKIKNNLIKKKGVYYVSNWNNFNNNFCYTYGIDNKMLMFEKRKKITLKNIKTMRKNEHLVSLYGELKVNGYLRGNQAF